MPRVTVVAFVCCTTFKMRFWATFVAFTAHLAAFATLSAKLPSTFKRCHISAPEFQECVRANVEDAIHQLRNGAPELGVAPMEPLFISEMSIGQGKGPVNVQQNFRNIRLHGLTDSKVLWHEVDLPHFQLRARSVTPHLRLDAEYGMKGRVLLLPVFGDGRCNVTLVNTRLNHTVSGEPVTRKGKLYMKITSYVVTLRPELVKFEFDNLFNGDERLGTEINRVLNENWSEIFADVRDGYEKSFGLIFQDLANRIFSKVPLNEIFLE